jgi:hypothetical protein
MEKRKKGKSKINDDQAKEWSNIWMQQSKLFNEIAKEQLQYFFDQGHYKQPDKHMDVIHEWLSILTKQWNFSPYNEQLKSYEQYTNLMNDMMLKTSQMLLDRWIAIAKTNQPINNVRDLYELWLSCCHDVYSETMHTKAYQDVYGELMNQTLQFWKTMMQNK